MMATVLLSQGVPMILAGDEFGRTQQGNNNAYCQDNEINWLDWSLCESDSEFLSFVKSAVELRRAEPLLRLRKFAGDKNNPVTTCWCGPQGNPMEDHQWQESFARCVMLLLSDNSDSQSETTRHLLLAFNASKEAQDMHFPATDGHAEWECRLDTSQSGTISKSKVADKFILAANSVLSLIHI